MSTSIWKSFKKSAADFIAIMRKSFFILIMVTIGWVLFCDIDQVRDVMWSFLSEGLNFKSVIFEIFVVIWAFQTWYSTRSLYDLTKFSPNNDSFSQGLQIWLPRIFGALIFVLICFAYQGAYDQHIPFINLVLAILINIILGAAFLLFTIFRRVWFKIADQKRKIRNEAYSIEGDFKTIWENWGYDIVSVGIFILLMVLFIISKVIIPQTFGTNSIIIAFFAFLTSTGVILIYFMKRKYIPVVFLAVAFLVVFSYFNNNHVVRLIDRNSDPAKEAAFAQSMTNYIKTPDMNYYFDKWAQNHGKGPIFIIAVEGGGMRSAYWSSYLFSAMQDMTGTNSSFVRLNDRTFALSSVSGGSLGSSVYLSLLDESLKKQNSRPLADQSAEILGRDLLSPVISSMFFPDFLQRFLPVPIPYFDRARALEKALESSWNQTVSNQSISNSFYALWSGRMETNDYSIPFLFLNTSSVEKGNRVIISSIPFGDSFNDSVDFNTTFSNYSYRMRLSTASFLSARFPYITPAARLLKQPDNWLATNNIWGHVADGGYFENSGAATVFDMITKIFKIEVKQVISKETNINIPIPTANRPTIYAIVIKDEPITENKISRWCNELTQPIQTFLNTWTSRTPYSISVLRNLLGSSNVLEFNLFFSGDDVPVGWYLSKDAQNIVVNYTKYLLLNGNTNSTNLMLPMVPYTNLTMLFKENKPYQFENERNVANMRKWLGLLKK